MSDSQEELASYLFSRNTRTAPPRIQQTDNYPII